MGTVVSFLIRETDDEDVRGPSVTATASLRSRGDLTLRDPGGDGERLAGSRQGDRATAALRGAVASLHAADDVFSTWKPDSPMSRLRRGEIRLGDAPPEVAEVLALCENARALSAGWFDPWRLPGGVDPTGLVKGWAAQRALGALEKAGLAAAMVNAGGDIAVFGEPSPGEPWHMGVRDPRSTDGLLCVVAIKGTGALATSGTYERGAHITNPVSGKAATRVVSATVAGPDLSLADALATALVASDGQVLERIAALPGYSALVMGADFSVRATSRFPGLLPEAA